MQGPPDDWTPGRWGPHWPHSFEPPQQPANTQGSGRGLAALAAGALLLVGYLVAKAIEALTRALRIFVSYDYDNDRHYRHLLSAWSANPRFSFSFEDHSTPKINSEQAARIKAAITVKMKAADCLLVIVGRDTHKSRWVAWEIEKAKELGLALVAVKIERAHRTPPALAGAGAKWAYSFSEAAIAKAVTAANS